MPVTTIAHHSFVLTLAELNESIGGGRGKLMTSLSPHPYTVTHIKGILITAQRNGHSRTQNESHFKVLRGQAQLLANPEERRDVDNFSLQATPERQ